MYLSRLYLDPGAGATPETDRVLRSLYALHQAVFAAYDRDKRGEGGVMFRREPELREGLVVILVQSVCKPEWGRGDSRPFVAVRPPEVQPICHQLRSGQRLRFRLRANPTRRNHAGKRRSILSGLGKGAGCEPAYQQAVLDQLAARGEASPSPTRVREYVMERWLVRQLKSAAADMEFRVTDEGLITDCKSRDSRPLEFKSVRYDGILEVGDPEILGERVAGGIGSAKGFGFGLLSLARA